MKLYGELQEKLGILCFPMLRCTLWVLVFLLHSLLCHLFFRAYFANVLEIAFINSMIPHVPKTLSHSSDLCLMFSLA